jgi:hypothetical protein
VQLLVFTDVSIENLLVDYDFDSATVDCLLLLFDLSIVAAQNLVLMMQLQPGTASLAPATARLLLQMYTLAVVPVTLWVSVFAKLVL